MPVLTEGHFESEVNDHFNETVTMGQKVIYIIKYVHCDFYNICKIKI